MRERSDYRHGARFGVGRAAPSCALEWSVVVKLSPIEEAFLEVDQIAEDLIRLVGKDLKYEAAARAALKRIMEIKQSLIEAVKE